MQRRSFGVLLAIVPASLPACAGEGDGGGDGGGATTEIDCAWLEAQNCWRDAVDAARVCAPDEALMATLAADRLSCSYSDGSEVTFENAVAADPIDTEWSFEVWTGGELCLSYLDASTPGQAATEVTTSEGLLTASGTLDDFTLTCPDGSRHHSADFLGLYQSCPAAEGGLPLLTVQSNPDGFGLELGDEVDGTVTLLQCAE